MQNKGAIRVVAIIFALICLYQLSFTYFSKKVESNAKEYATNQYAKNLAANLAKGDALREQEIFDSIATMRENFYLDSVSEKTAYNFLWMRKFSYKECKAREVNLGLDLKGGMNVMMEVSTIDVLKNLASNPNDPELSKLISLAEAKHKETGDRFIDCFERTVNEAAKTSKVDLSAFFRVKLKEKGITANSSNTEVIKAIRQECTDADDDRILDHLAGLIQHRGAERDVERRQIDAADEVADERHEHVAHKTRGDLAEGGGDDHADSHIQNVASGNKLLEFVKEFFHKGGLLSASFSDAPYAGAR